MAGGIALGDGVGRGGMGRRHHVDADGSGLSAGSGGHRRVDRGMAGMAGGSGGGRCVGCGDLVFEELEGVDYLVDFLPLCGHTTVRRSRPKCM